MRRPQGGEGDSEEADESLVQHGSYSYTAPDGSLITLTYTADEMGFRATGDHIPTPPPVPPEIQRSLDIIYAQIQRDQEEAEREEREDQEREQQRQQQQASSDRQEESVSAPQRHANHRHDDPRDDDDDDTSSNDTRANDADVDVSASSAPARGQETGVLEAHGGKQPGAVSRHRRRQ